MAEGGVPQGEFEDPPTDGVLAVSVRHFAAHVAHGGYTTEVGMECPGTNPQRVLEHTGHRTDRDPLEGGGVADRHLSTHNPPVA